MQVVTRILTQAKRDRASDVHIEPSQDVVRVRFRIDGALKEVLRLPSAMGVGLVSRIKIMAGMNIVERRRPQDGQLTAEIDGKDTDVRVATAATIWGENCVMRILDKNRSVLRLHDLGMPTDTHETFSQAREGALWHGAVRRTDRERKDHHALRHLGPGRRPDQERHDDRGPGRVRLPVDQPDPDQRAGGIDLRNGTESRFCVRTPTPSSSERSETSRRRESPSSPP